MPERGYELFKKYSTYWTEYCTSTVYTVIVLLYCTVLLDIVSVASFGPTTCSLLAVVSTVLQQYFTATATATATATLYCL